MTVSYKHHARFRNEIEEREAKALTLLVETIHEILDTKDFTFNIQRQTGWAGSRTFYAAKYEYQKNVMKLNIRNLYGFTLMEKMRAVTSIFIKSFDRKSFSRQNVDATVNSITVMNIFKEFAPYLQEQYGERQRKINHKLTDIKYNRDGRTIQFFSHRAHRGKVFWANVEQIGASYWTRSSINKLFREHEELLLSQPVEYVTEEITFEDLIC